MRWFERYAAKHKPDFKSSTGFGWKFFDFCRFHVLLAVKTHTVLDTRVCEIRSLSYTLSGNYLEHRRDGDKAFDDYVYTDSEGRWVVHEVHAGQVRLWDKGDEQRMELFPAQSMQDRLFDMPEWMTINDVEFHSEKQVWVLLFAWFKS